MCDLYQGYGLTETGGGASRLVGPEEWKRHGSAGRLAENMEAKIVDPVSGEALPPGQRGELWLRGSTVMIGSHYSLHYFDLVLKSVLPAFCCSGVDPHNIVP